MCPKGGHEMKVIVVITYSGECTRPLEVQKMLVCLKCDKTSLFVGVPVLIFINTLLNRNDLLS